jgi:hypothetical protein
MHCGARIESGERHQSAPLAEHVTLYLDLYWRMAESVKGNPTAIPI